VSATEEQRAAKAAYMRAYSKDPDHPERRSKHNARVQRWREKNRVKNRWISRSSMQRRMGLFITRQQELAIYEASDGLCAVCLERPAEAVDHDHKTGEPRGALCHKCNQGLGCFFDSVDRLEAAIEYLGLGALGV